MLDLTETYAVVHQTKGIILVHTKDRCVDYCFHSNSNEWKGFDTEKPYKVHHVEITIKEELV